MCSTRNSVGSSPTTKPAATRTTWISCSPTTAGSCDPLSCATASTGPSQKAGIAHTTVHDLRRTFGSILIAAGADVTYVQRQMGHSSPHVTLLHYAGLWDEQKNTDKVAAYLNLLDTAN